MEHKPPNTPKKNKTEKSRVKNLTNDERRALLKNGKNIKEMFEPNENVVNITHHSNFRPNFSAERPAENRRAGLVTPPRKTMVPWAAPGKLPGEPPSLPKRFRKTRRASRKVRKN